MGLRGVETGDGVVTLAMARSPWPCNAFGVIYGGAIADLADAERGPLCVKPVVACSCAGDCGRCSPVSSSFLPAPASRSRAGLQLDSGSAPAGSALIRSRRRCERSLVGGGGFRVGGGPGVACPKSRSIGV